MLTILDNHSRVSLFIGVAFAYKGYDVEESLRTGEAIWVPKRIQLDNGPKFVSGEVDLGAYANRVALDFSRQRKPTDNTLIESLNTIFRSECLNQHWFPGLADAKQKIEARRQDYNRARPCSPVGDVLPEQFRQEAMAASQ